MPAYANLSGKSGVIAYDDSSPDEILVTFRTGRYRHYLYTAASCGTAAVNVLRSRARAGKGLNSYISSHVRTGYASRS